MFLKTCLSWCCVATAVFLLAGISSADDACTSSPCQNGGRCIPTSDSFNCLCITGYTGDTCSEEEDPCKVVPCPHGGTCNSTSSVSGQYSCTYTVDNADGGNPCDNTPCQDGETCVYEATTPDLYVCLRYVLPPGGPPLGPNLVTPPIGK